MQNSFDSLNFFLSKYQYSQRQVRSSYNVQDQIKWQCLVTKMTPFFSISLNIRKHFLLEKTCAHNSSIEKKNKYDS